MATVCFAIQGEYTDSGSSTRELKSKADLINFEEGK